MITKTLAAIRKKISSIRERAIAETQSAEQIASTIETKRARVEHFETVAKRAALRLPQLEKFLASRRDKGHEALSRICRQALLTGDQLNFDQERAVRELEVPSLVEIFDDAILKIARDVVAQARADFETAAADLERFVAANT